MSQKLFICGPHFLLRFEAHTKRQIIHKTITYLVASKTKVGPLAKGQPHSLVANNAAANAVGPKIIGKFVMKTGY